MCFTVCIAQKSLKCVKIVRYRFRRVASSISGHVSFLWFSIFPCLSRMNMASAFLSHLVWAIQPLRFPRPAGLQIFTSSKVFALISTFLCLELHPPCPSLLALLAPLPLVHPCSSTSRSLPHRKSFLPFPPPPLILSPFRLQVSAQHSLSLRMVSVIVCASSSKIWLSEMA